MTLRKILVPILAGAFVFASLPIVKAQPANPFSTAAIQAWKNSITGAGHFGAPRYTTALLPTCSTANTGAVVYDTTDGALKSCDGSSWDTAGGLTSPIAGDFVATGKWTFGSAADAANSVRLGETAGAIVGEGATANTEELTLAFGDSTADNTLTLLGTATGVTFAVTTGSAQFTDNDVIFCDDGDFTKCVAFQASGITTGTTRSFTWPNLAGTQTLLVTGASANGQSFSGALVSASADGSNGAGLFLGAYNNANNAIQWGDTETPDTGHLLTGSTGNSWIIKETADRAGDCAHAVPTNPTVWTHSTTSCASSTTNFSALDYLGVQPNRTTVTVNGATTFALTSGYIVLECTGAETINTITGATRAGAIIYVENTDTECTIADDDSATAADAIDLTGTATNDVGAVAKVITLVYNGSHWLQTAESDN